MAMSDLDKIQMGLAASGMVPGPTGMISDLADAGISLGRGDLLGALLAGGAAIPGIGMAFGARHARHLGKLGRGGGRSAMDVHDIVKARRAAAEEAAERASLEKIKVVDDAGEPYDDLYGPRGAGAERHAEMEDEFYEEYDSFLGGRSRDPLEESMMAEKARTYRGGKGMADFPDEKMLDEASNEIKKLDEHYDMMGDDMYDNLESWETGAGDFAIRIEKKDPIAVQLYSRAKSGRPGGIDPRDDFKAIVRASELEKKSTSPAYKKYGDALNETDDPELIAAMTDDYMKTGDMRFLPSGVQATDVDKGFYPAGRAPYGTDIERAANPRQASYGLDPYEGQHVEEMWHKDMAEYIAKHGGPPPRHNMPGNDPYYYTDVPF